MFASFKRKYQYMKQKLIQGILFSPNGDYLFISFGFCIRKICIKTGKVRHIVRFGRMSEGNNKSIPHKIVMSPDGEYILVCDWISRCILKICLKTRKVSVFAGIQNVVGDRDGPKEQALFACINDLTFSNDGKLLIICDGFSIKYMKIKN